MPSVSCTNVFVCYAERDINCWKCSAKGDINMAELILKTNQPEKAAAVIKQAIAAKIARIEYSRQQARKRLNYFEQKYYITSEQFINEWAAEDLEGKDMEYVKWAGEYHLFLEVEAELSILKSIEYVSQ